jgi:nitrogen regulatory protein PII
MRDWRDLMKVIETIINTANLDELKAALNNIGIEKIMVSHLVNNSRKKGRDVLHWGADYMFGLMTKIKVEIIAADELVGRVIETIGEIARTDSKGDCRILIHPFVEASI